MSCITDLAPDGTIRIKNMVGVAAVQGHTDANTQQCWCELGCEQIDQRHDGMHVIYESVKKAGGKLDGDSLIAAAKGLKWDSPRGPMSLTRSHNPIHDIYLRKVEGKENKVVGIAVKDLTDPPRGCKL